MNIIAVIPERMRSKRFPGKPLAQICGVPMVGHIYARTLMAKNIDGVYVASPDKEILDYIRSCGGKGALEPTIPINAPTTIVKALPEIERDFGKTIDWVIMVQGDEPMIHPETIDALASYVKTSSNCKAVNLITNLENEKEYYDPNIVKIVLNQKDEGIWFFRTPTESWRKDILNLPIKKQTGIIAFNKNFLLSLGAGDKTPLEKTESVDMFRLIEMGETLPTILSDRKLYSIDTETDRILVESVMKLDPLSQLYEEKFKN